MATCDYYTALMNNQHRAAHHTPRLDTYQYCCNI